jgi:phosphohistidine phosphatase
VSADQAQNRRHLWVLRHAKAAASSRDGRDHSRPLTKRGKAQAEATARHVAELRRRGVPVPRAVVSSSARRALKTAELVLRGLDKDVSLEVDDDLYQADPDEVLEELSHLDDGLRSVMIVGHNPTFAELVELLVARDSASDATRQGGNEAGEMDIGSFPTCALAHLSVPAERWEDVAEGSGSLEELFVPEV